MAIGGDNNRVAGRDYYEYSGKVELMILPCPRCEERIIQPGKERCNHCQAELDAEEAKGKLTLFGFAVLLVWGGAMHLGDLSLKEIGIESFLYMGVASFVTVFLLCLMWSFLSGFWQANR